MKGRDEGVKQGVTWLDSVSVILSPTVLAPKSYKFHFPSSQLPSFYSSLSSLLPFLNQNKHFLFIHYHPSFLLSSFLLLHSLTFSVIVPNPVSSFSFVSFFPSL
ncbi:hypothetical protein RJT34_03764 [Clitoria ternatea]|uniref:Transmembrane protein n=1 Tax=Clitoria ternatea TaxID=43366 RepID=A0AAN9Q213_CLITE